MKLLVLFICAFALVQLVDMEKAQDYYETCMEEHEVDMDDLESAAEGDMPPNVKCFYKCVMERRGMLRGNRLDSEKMKSLCIGNTTDDSNSCHIGFAYKRCIDALQI